MLFKDVTFSGGGFRYIPPQPTFLLNKDWGSFGTSDRSVQVRSVQYTANTSTYFVASNNGSAYRSSDGVNWQQQTNGVLTLTQTGSVNAIAYNGTRYVALLRNPRVPQDRGIVYSDDGNTWIRANTAIANNATGGMVWSGSYFVCHSSESPQNFLWSGDGGGWGNASGYSSSRPNDSYTFAANTASNLVVAHSVNSGASCYRSGDGGLSYSVLSYPGTGSPSGKLSFTAGAFVSSRTNNTIVYSSDGFFSWTQTGNIFPTTNNVINGLANNSDIVVGVQNNGGIITTDRNNFPNISNNKWTSRTSGTSKNLIGVIFDGSKFIVNGEDGIILNSSNGIDWTTVKLPQLSTAFISPTRVTTGIVQGSTIIISGEYEPFGESPVSLNYVSTNNGNTWQTANTGGVMLSTIIYDGTKFLGGSSSSNVLYTSTNGTSWTGTTLNSLGSNAISFLAYGASSTNKYVISSGFGSNIFTSTDGNTFSGAGSITNFRTTGGIMYDGTRYIAFGFNSSNHPTISVSTEGTSWTTTTVEATSGTVYGLAFNGSRYIAVGSGLQAAGVVWTSTDLTTWTRATIPTFNQNEILYAVNYSATTNQWFAVGEGGRIITSKDGLTWSNSSPTQARPSFIAISGDYIFANTCLTQFTLV